MKYLKDENGKDIGIVEAGGRFSKRFANLSDKEVDFGDGDIMLSEFEPSSTRLIRIAAKHSAFLKNAGMPYLPEICVDKLGDWVSTENIDSWEGEKQYLDLHITYHLGNDRDSLPALSAKIVTNAYLALIDESEDPLLHSFFVGEACALWEVYKTYDIGQLKKGGTRKSRKNVVLMALLEYWLKVEPKTKSQQLLMKFDSQHQDIELEMGEVEFWCEDDPFFVYISLDGGKSARFSERTFRGYVKNVKAGQGVNS